MNKRFLEYKTAVFIQSVLERQLTTYRDKLQRQQKDKNCTSKIYEETLDYCSSLEDSIKEMERFKV